MSDFNPYAVSATDAFVASYFNEGADIGALSVSNRWKRRFHLIKAAGGIARAGYGTTGFNVLAFFFGPIYYLCKGMWKKAIGLFMLLFAINIAFGIFLALTNVPRSLVSPLSILFSIGLSMTFAMRANIDYYKKKVLNDKSWW